MDEVGGINWWACPEVDDTLRVESDRDEHLLFWRVYGVGGLFAFLPGVAHAIEFFGHHGFDVHLPIIVIVVVIVVGVLPCGFGFLKWPVKFLCILFIPQFVSSSDHQALTFIVH